MIYERKKTSTIVYKGVSMDADIGCVVYISSDGWNKGVWVSGYDSKKQPKIVVKGLNNYTKNLELTFNILPKDIADADVTIDDLSVAYNNGKDLYSKLAPVIYYKGKALKKNTDFTIASGVYKDAGNYKVTITGKGNYTGSQHCKA